MASADGTRVAMLGDVQGRLDALNRALSSLGVKRGRTEAEETWPEGLTVVQVGDLIHRGPASDAVVAVAARELRAGRWIQLFGNHEAVHLPAGRWIVPGDERLSPETIATIEHWYDCDVAQMAVAVDGLLITHAGMTARRWRDLGCPATADEAAGALNFQARLDPVAAFRAGWVLTGTTLADPGVIWTHPAVELYPGWLGEPVVPFGQVHGHMSAFRWHTGAWDPATPRELRRGAIVDIASHHLTVTIGGQPFIGIDPDLGPRAPGNLVPFVR
jgi:hypothetical protein